MSAQPDPWPGPLVSQALRHSPLPRAPLPDPPDVASKANRQPWTSREDLWWSHELWEAHPTWRLPQQAIPIRMPDGAGRRRVVRQYRYHPDPDPPRRLFSSRHVRRALAALGMWHTLSATQLTTTMGYPETKRGHILRPLWDAGYAYRGRWRPQSISWRTPYLYRMCRTPQLDSWAERLSDDDWLDAGVDWWTTGREATVRHDMLAAELGLRAMEIHPQFPLAVGEPLAGAQQLLGHGGRQRGDLVLVRHDGLRVIVEITANPGRANLKAKIAAWGRALAQAGPVSEHSTIVVFLAAARAAQQTQVHRQLRSLCHNTLTPSGLAAPDGARPSARQTRHATDALHVARWDDWFPGPWTVSDRWWTLRADRWTGKAWEPTHLATDHTPNPTAKNIYDHVAGAWWLPAWWQPGTRTAPL